MRIFNLFLLSLGVSSVFAQETMVSNTVATNAVAAPGRSLSNAAEDSKEVLLPGSKIIHVSTTPKAGSATEFVTSSIVKVEKLLADNKADSKSVGKRDPEIKKAVSSVLDLGVLGQQALSTHWVELGKNAAGKKQRDRYENLFRSLVEENYLEKIRQYIGGDHHIHFMSEAPTKNGVKVLARILKKDVDVMVEFDVVKDGKSWKVIDTRLDDTSLQETYRSSFNRIIRKNGGLTKGFPELLKVMDKRLTELKKGKATQL